jgi:hypothetical protein
MARIRITSGGAARECTSTVLPAPPLEGCLPSLKGLLKLPFRAARRVVRTFTGGSAPKEADEVRLPVRTNPEGPSQKPVAAPPLSNPIAPQPGQMPGTADSPPPTQANPEAPQPPEEAAPAAEEAPKKGKGKKKAEAAPEPAPAPEEAPKKGKGKKKAEEPAAAKVRVTGENTPNPNAMKFSCSVKVVPKGSLSLNNAGVAAAHPLGAAIFAVPGVRAVFAVNDFVTVTKEESASWDDLRPRLEVAISEVLSQ